MKNTVGVPGVRLKMKQSEKKEKGREKYNFICQDK